METFGLKLRIDRNTRDFSEFEFPSKIYSDHPNIKKYKRDEVIPTIDLVKKQADELETTVGFLLGDTEDRAMLHGTSMMNRLNDIAKFPKQEKVCILYVLDAMINNDKLKVI